ncbi:MAG: hypothetical protein JWN30_2434 [Bacilli bacterium]|nr:hypothetical protein [Bacilli bacterium]
MSVQKLANRYELIDRIGGGGMAVVYRALDTLLNRNVSVKVLRSQYASDEEFVRRFRREAQAAASLSHPNIVNIYDVGTEGETHYIVMEYIDGFTLKELIQSEAPLSVSRSIQITRQICAALKNAHENNIVHRDIKPHNILIGKDGRLKVTDFGIARATTSNAVTQTGSILGSVHYFSPEQARGGITDVKSDIYSLGIVLYEMLTGKLPFSGESPVSVALKHLQEPFIEPRQLDPDLPQSLENVILKCLCKDPDFRYASMQDMIADLDTALEHPNVPKFIAPAKTDQDTIQIPALGIQRARGDEANSLYNPENNEPGLPNGAAGRKRKWAPWILWPLGILLALGFAGAAAYEVVSFVTGNFTVKQTQMPSLNDKTYQQAVQQLQSLGFSPDSITKTDAYPPSSDPVLSKIPSGQVFDQDPKANTLVKVSHPVTLYISKGAEAIQMPKLTGLSRDDATKALTNAKIDPAQVTWTEDFSKDVASGSVISQTPDPSTSVTPSNQISVVVSKGQDMATMPDLTGMTKDDAYKALAQNGFVPGNVTSQPSDKQVNTVIKQSPTNPNAQAQKGSTEDFVYSSGPASKTWTYSLQLQSNSRPVQVTIKLTDSVSKDSTVYDQMLTGSQTVPISITLKSTDSATINIYQNGKLSDTKTVPYPQN